MPRRRRSQLSKNSSQARLVKVRRIGESSSENADRLEIMRVYASQSRARELSVERSIRLAEQNARYERQSSAERSQRLEENRARNSRTRARESSTERSQRLLTQRDRQRSLRARTRNRILAHSNRSAFSYDPQIEYAHQNSIQIGAMNKMCPICFAKKWAEEAKGMCCASGKVVLPNIDEPPEPIKSLLTNNHILSAHFLNNVRRYNSLFQMTSFGAKEIKEGHFMPTFKVEGQVYHLIGSLLPPSGQIPQFLQIYFISDADQLSLRSNTAPMLKLNLINELQTMLNSHNVYIRSFKHSIELNTPDSLKLIIYSDRTPHTEHRGRYNAPSINEVAVLLVDEDKGPRDIVLHGRDGQLKRVSELHRAYDPLQYPLMFASGDDGYYLTIPQQNSSRNKTVSCMQYYAYRLMIRANCFNALHYYKDLFNQYCVDMMAKMISERLNFVYRNQQKLRADDYIHLRDALNQDARVIAANIGQHVILPSSFTGSPRYLHEKTQDAMTYVRNYGRPDLFITFTCNPDWQEIKQELFPGQRSFDRHDIIARVFHLKMKKMIKILIKDAIFGPVKCYMLTVEWQKRGLPHCHMLLWLNSKVQPDEIDKIIVAELPNKDEDPVLFEIVTKNMVHGPCGQENLTSPCMKNWICTKKYPRRFVTETQTGEDGYPVYRRRDIDNGGQIGALNVRGRTVNIDNRWIVPYSPILCRSFNAHINVEYCHSVQAIKYICKYINKGSDQATFSVRNAHDEVENYLNGRYISTSEAVWRILEFPIHDRHPTVVHLAVHLESGQRVYFSAENMQNIAQNPPKTTLTAFFDLCHSDGFAKTLLYHEVPHYYTWANNKFSRRKRGQEVVGHPGIKKDAALGRVYSVHPSQSECFYLRILLHHVRGPTSFQDLKTVDGVVKETYQAACRERGLLEDDNQWETTLREASISQCPLRLRELFVVILLFCFPSEPLKLWDTFKDDLCEDIRHIAQEQGSDYDVYNKGLIQIENKLLELNDKSLRDFGLPSPNRSQNVVDAIPCRIYDVNELSEFVNSNVPKLVADQKIAYDAIIESVENNSGQLFFLDAPGGTGKTFLANLVLSKVRLSGRKALAVASSGIAATLLYDGKTAHSTFKLPLTVSLDQQSVCSIRKNGPLGKLLQDTSLIIWDECTMSHRAHVEAVDRTLKDIRNSCNMMGGVTFVFAGDFRQTLPVVTKGTRADVIKACLKSSPFWLSIKTLNLRTNMRAHLCNNRGGNFSENILKLGDGQFTTPIANSSQVLLDIGLAQTVHSLEILIDKIYPDINNLTLKALNQSSPNMFAPEPSTTSKFILCVEFAYVTCTASSPFNLSDVPPYAWRDLVVPVTGILLTQLANKMPRVNLESHRAPIDNDIYHNPRP
ncbi:uncharacterized protein LOC129948797 [Eupeodes corollae]|uniref:uncharacterized protein LOC129948797 n=1 Tax=Eupeodes corollae TaxID=290404 RepID=UPI0024912DE3|nr:uncharacterized protein LOC129948797 [Eupeodes corollae]